MKLPRIEDSLPKSLPSISPQLYRTLPKSLALDRDGIHGEHNLEPLESTNDRPQQVVIRLNDGKTRPLWTAPSGVNIGMIRCEIDDKDVRFATVVAFPARAAKLGGIVALLDRKEGPRWTLDLAPLWERLPLAPLIDRTRLLESIVSALPMAHGRWTLIEMARNEFLGMPTPFGCQQAALPRIVWLVDAVGRPRRAWSCLSAVRPLLSGKFLSRDSSNRDFVVHRPDGVPIARLAGKLPINLEELVSAKHGRALICEPDESFDGYRVWSLP